MNTEITNLDLKLYNEEFRNLIAQRKRVELQIEAILTTAAIKLEEAMNKRRLDYTHLSNAYVAFTENNTESMQFAIVNQTVKDLFFLEQDKFEFSTIIPYQAGPFEYLYRYNNKTISIKIPTAPKITKDNINELNWGLITVCEVVNRAEVITEKVIIVESDDTDLIARKLADYLTVSTDTNLPEGVSTVLL